MLLRFITLFKVIPVAVAMIAMAGIANLAQAAIINGDFETGTLSSWTSIGNASVVGSGYGAGPLGGSFNALIETGFEKPPGGSSSTGVTDADIEVFFGIAAGSLDPFTPIGVTEGSAIKQSFTAAAGDTISFDYQILADDCAISGCPGSVEDFAFVSLTIDGFLAALISTFDPIMVSSGSPYFAESGIFSFSHTLTTGGLVEIGVAILDGGDTIVPSALLVDNFSFTAAEIPEPATLTLFGLGLLGLGAARRRKKRAA